MEKTVFKMLAVSGVVVGLGMASLPLSSFAADDTPTLPEYEPGTMEGQMEVNVVIANHLALDVDGTIFHGGFNTEGILNPTEGEESQDSLYVMTNTIATVGVPSDDDPDPEDGLWTGVQSSVPYQLSISADDNALVNTVNPAAKISANKTLDARYDRWAIMKNKLKAGQTGAVDQNDYEADVWASVTDEPKVFQTGPATRDTTDAFVPVRFGVGVSASPSLQSGNYVGDVTFTIAPQV